MDYFSSSWSYVRGEREIDKNKERKSSYNGLDKLVEQSKKKRVSAMKHWELVRRNLKTD